MARATELFAEEVHVMKALYQDYNRRTDLDTISATEQDINDICATCTSREADARNAISGKPIAACLMRSNSTSNQVDFPGARRAAEASP